MNEIKNIVSTPSGGQMRVAAGEHFADPLVLEAGSRRRVSIELEAGAKLHLAAFVLAVDEAANGAPEGTAEKMADGGGVPSGDGGRAERETNTSLSVTVDLKGEGAEFHLHALYVASGSGESAGRADIDVKVNHSAPSGTSRQLIKGIAGGTATGSFAGMVHVARDAQHTDAVQRNQNLQLSDTAHIFTRPQLEIYADDVRCSHGATIGRLDDQAVYYMRQRGVSEAEARRMQLQGFAGEIINHCPSESLRESLAARIGAIIDNL